MDSGNYRSPLAERYASAAMRHTWSDDKKFTTWRRLWIALAESEQELGLAITDSQLDELRAHVDDIDYERARHFEGQLRHDVMAHVHAWGEQCPEARGIIHLGATSCFVGDNTDLILLRDALAIVKAELVGVIARMKAFALEWRSLPTLGFTHFQPAQATTVGKRACLWLQDLVANLEDLEHAERAVRFRGCKGATGTQASFLELFGGDADKVRRLDRLVTEKMGFESTFGVTGQTYPRLLDFRVLQVLAGIAIGAHKFATDLRLLAHKREVEEPFEEHQIGSSAMPWKRNPMRSERICALSRFVIALLDNPAHTAATQWFERTLDDSANRRLALAEAFLATDAVLNLWLNVASGLVVHPAVVTRHLTEELPFLASEHLLMAAVQAGGDRQEVHEILRQHAREASKAIHAGGDNPLRERLGAEPAFRAVRDRFDELLDPARYVGRAPEQVLEFIADEVDPLLARHAGLGDREGDVRV